MKKRIAILISHPIQYQAPFFAMLANDPSLDIRIFYCSNEGLKEKIDSGFGISVAWDRPLLEGYTYTFLKNYSPFRSVNTFFGLINPGIIAHLLSKKYDVVLIHGYQSCTTFLAYAAALLSGTPIIFRGETIVRNSGSSVKNFLKKIFIKTFFSNIRANLYIGAESKEFYRFYGIPDDMLFFTPYAVDNDYFMQQKGRLPDARTLKGELYGSTLPVILYVAKFIDRKRPLDLLRAFEGLDTDAQLVFVGDGPLRSDMEKIISEKRLSHVHITGFVNQSELPRYYASGDVFVLPSAYESFGLVINEAMCFGLPIVTTQGVAAAKDLVRDNGHIVPIGDIQALRQSIRTILQDDQQKISMGKRSLEIISGWNYTACIQGIRSALATLHGT